MAEITVELIRKLREITGSGMMDCKKALTEASGEMDKAIAWLREKGIANAEKKSQRVAAEGIVEAYIHGGGRVGVMIEVNIETDFAANNQEFRQLVKDLAMQVAAMNPDYVSRADVPEAVMVSEREIARNQALNEGKPEKIIDRIVEGRLEKYFEQFCLMDQAFIKDDSKKVHTVVKEMIGKIGENINVRRFVRYQLGEGIERKQDDFAAEVMKQIG